MTNVTSYFLTPAKMVLTQRMLVLERTKEISSSSPHFRKEELRPRELSDLLIVYK